MEPEAEAGSAWAQALDIAGKEGLDAAVEFLLGQLTRKEKLRCLSGSRPVLQALREDVRRYNGKPIPGGGVPRLGIPGVRFTDGPRGVVMGRSTAFPVAMARGATFDPELEQRVGDAIGVEARAQGANFFGGVCINLLRHPAWGRAQETFGEDSLLLGAMGAALVRGTQRHLMACAKHFALNSMENSRFMVDVSVDDATLHDIYLPHFRKCVEAGVASIMSAYNKVNGAWCGHNGVLLRDVLKGQWGFDGFVMSDFLFGVRDGVAALKGGLDIEMPLTWRFGILPRALAEGRVREDEVEDAVRRLVRQQLRFARVGEPERYRREAVACRGHRQLAREVSDRSTVLLQNDPVREGGSPLLPFSNRIRRLAVVGRLADLANTGDHGSSRVRPPDVVTVAQGMREAAERRGVVVDVVAGDSARAARGAAACADAVVVVVGNAHRDEGENLLFVGGDRRRLGLARRQVELVRAVVAVNPNVVVVLIGGAPILCEEWRRLVPSILMAWYPGMEGGRSVAGIVFGDVLPSGRLPCTWPASVDQLPPFRAWTRRITYGPLHGYRALMAAGQHPSWWFGHGLGYSAAAIRRARVDGNGVQVELANTGDREVVEVVQVYVDVALGSDSRRLPALCGFRRVRLEPGEVRTIEVSPESWMLERARSAGEIVLNAGRSADPRSWVRVEG